jgi:hypothetical protein
MECASSKCGNRSKLNGQHDWGAYGNMIGEPWEEELMAPPQDILFGGEWANFS